MLTEYFLSEPHRCVYCTNPCWNFCAEHSPLESGTSKLLECKIDSRFWLCRVQSGVWLISCCEATADFLETHVTHSLQLKSQFKTLFFIDLSFFQHDRGTLCDTGTFEANNEDLCKHMYAGSCVCRCIYHSSYCLSITLYKWCLQFGTELTLRNYEKDIVYFTL